MAEQIDPIRLKQVRMLRRLSQESLAKAARLNKQTVYRLEAGGRPTRKGTIERLAKVLNIEATVLTGQKPLPAEASQGGNAVEDVRYQLKTRLDACTRNAFSFAALRYGVSTSKIVELAPLLFVIVAEMSLKQRGEKLAELETAIASLERLEKNFPHLPSTVAAPWSTSSETIQTEKRSIKARDLFMDWMSDDIFWDAPETQEYDEATDNPFAAFLTDLAYPTNGAAVVNWLTVDDSSYEVCREDALTLSGGDERIAHGLLQGWVLIHEIPRELLEKDRTDDRVNWMRPKIEENWKAAEKALQELFLPEGELFLPENGTST